MKFNFLCVQNVYSVHYLLVQACQQRPMGGAYGEEYSLDTARVKQYSNIT